MNFTPGPWDVRPSFAGSQYLHIKSPTSDSVACTESEADARLIAAAPELLEALKMANEMLKDCAEELCAAGMSPIVECIRESTKLIAKAEGK